MRTGRSLTVLGKFENLETPPKKIGDPPKIWRTPRKIGDDTPPNLENPPENLENPPKIWRPPRKIWDPPPPPPTVDRILDTRFWKYFLGPTSLRPVKIESH